MTATSDNLTKDLRRNASWLFSGGVVTSIFAAVEPVLLARFLGVEQFGLFALIIAYTSIVKNGIVNFRSPEGTTKYVGQYLELGEKDKVLSFIKFFYLLDLLEGFLAFTVCVLLAGVANDLFIHSDNAFNLIVIYSISLLVSSNNRNSESILKVFDKFKILAFIRPFATGLRVILVAVCLFLGLGIQSVLICYVIVAFVLLTVLHVSVFRVLKRQGFKRWTSAKLGNLGFITAEVRSFIYTSIYSGFLNSISSRDFPVLILGHFASKEAAGLYKVATAFSSVKEKLQFPAGEAIYPPLVTAQARGSRETLSKIVSHSVKNLMKVFLPIGLVFFLFANEIIVILFGTEYQPAAVAMQIIVVSEILSGFYFWIDSVDMALIRLRQRIMRITVCSAFYFTALFMLIPTYSYNGAAVSTLISSILLLVFSLFTFNEIRVNSK